MTAAESTKEKWYEAEINRIAGEIALKPPERDTAKAESYFVRALTVARQQQAKSWELRIAMSIRGSGMRLAIFSPRSTAGLLKGTIHSISRRRRLCSANLRRERASDSRADPRHTAIGRRHGMTIPRVGLGMLAERDERRPAFDLLPVPLLY